MVLIFIYILLLDPFSFCLTYGVRCWALRKVFMQLCDINTAHYIIHLSVEAIAKQRLKIRTLMVKYQYTRCNIFLIKQCVLSAYTECEFTPQGLFILSIFYKVYQLNLRKFSQVQPQKLISKRTALIKTIACVIAMSQRGQWVIIRVVKNGYGHAVRPHGAINHIM